MNNTTNNTPVYVNSITGEIIETQRAAVETLRTGVDVDLYKNGVKVLTWEHYEPEQPTQPEPAATAAEPAPASDEPAAGPEPEQPAEPIETAQEKTDRENHEHCERIAQELETYAAGRVWRCPDCGKIIEIDDDDEDAPVCPDCGVELEQCSLWDFFDPENNDIYDIEYSIGGDMCYRSVRLMIACGGPNIYIDTGAKEVQLYWWSDRASYGLLSDTCEEIDSIYEEYFNSCR